MKRLAMCFAMLVGCGGTGFTVGSAPDAGDAGGELEAAAGDVANAAEGGAPVDVVVVDQVDAGEAGPVDPCTVDPSSEACALGRCCTQPGEWVSCCLAPGASGFAAAACLNGASFHCAGDAGGAWPAGSCENGCTANTACWFGGSEGTVRLCP